MLVKLVAIAIFTSQSNSIIIYLIGYEYLPILNQAASQYATNRYEAPVLGTLAMYRET